MSDIDLKFLGDTGKYDILGVKNGFRKLCELYIPQVVNEGNWFTVCHKMAQNQQDIMKIEDGEGVRLGTYISNIFQEGSYRTSIYKYMLMNFLCYIEVPTKSFRTDTGDFKKSYNKILATASTEVMARWLGVDIDELPSKYAERVFDINMDDGEDCLPYVKLVETRGVRKISVPRLNIDVSEIGTRVIPLFMLKAGVDTLYERFKEGMVKVSFFKDGGQLREMYTTLDFNKVREIYGGGSFLDDSINDSYDGNFLENKYLYKGFIKLPEIGGSRYDGPTRSLNYARIYSIEYNAEPDLSFINIDLTTVVEAFTDGVLANSSSAGEIIAMLEAFGIDGKAWVNTVEQGKRYATRDVSSLLQWVEERNLLYSTVFVRELCLFMLANPQWFKGFTGEPKNRYSSGDLGIE